MNTGSWSLNYFFSPISMWVFIVVILAAITLLISFLIIWINFMKNKDTSKMNLTVWILTVAGLGFLTLFYLIGVINSVTTGSKRISYHFLVVLCCEGISLIFSIHILLLKVININKSKKLMISEKEYCEQLKKRRQKKEF